MLIKYITLALMLCSFSHCIANPTTKSELQNHLIYQGGERCGISVHEELDSELNSDEDKYARVGEFPWTVAIYLKGEYLVVGTLVQRNFVLTASPFINNSNKNKLLIVAGDWDIANQLEEYPELNRRVDQIYTKDEIKLIRLKQSLSNHPHILSLCLPRSNDYFIWETAITTGWMKKTDDLGGIQETNKLRKLRYRIMSPAECFLQLPGIYNREAFSTKSNKVSDLKYICARNEMNLNSCDLKDGAPLFYYIGKSNILAGIALTTENCVSEKNAALFINVIHYVDWILYIISN